MKTTEFGSSDPCLCAGRDICSDQRQLNFIKLQNTLKFIIFNSYQFQSILKMVKVVYTEAKKSFTSDAVEVKSLKHEISERFVSLVYDCLRFINS